MRKPFICIALYIAFIGITMLSCSDNDKDNSKPKKPVWYEDKDGDGKGNPLVYVYSDIGPVGYVLGDNTDLDDNLPCDKALTFYRDKDGDGLGDPNDITLACTPPEGYVTNHDDDMDYAPLEYTHVDVPTPLIQLHFDENSGSDINSTGSLTLAPFTKTEPPTWSGNIARSGGTSSLDFGLTDGEYYVESAAIIPELAGMENVTVTGWVNNMDDATGSGGNRIVSWISNGGDGFDIVRNADGSMKIGINQWPDGSTVLTQPGKIPTSPSASASNWIFFAVTYESSSATVKIYFGDNNTLVDIDSTYTYDQGALGAGIGHLAVGHFNQESHRDTRTNRLFKGLIDEVEIWDSILTLGEIQTVQNE